MSKGYTVPTKNRFADLLSDSEGEEQAPITPAASGKQQPKPKQTTSQQPPAAKAKPTFNDAEERGFNQARGPRSPVKGSKGPFADNRAQPLEPLPGTIGEDQMEQSRAITRRRGGATVLGRGARLEGRTNRTFDRRSGTGRGTEMKRAGGGQHNWGNDDADFGADNAPVAGAPEPPVVDKSTEEIAGEPVEDAAEVGTPAMGADSRPASERIIDYNSYMKELKARRARLPHFDESQPSVDHEELEKDGYERYEREETSEEKAARELTLQHLRQSGGEDEDDSGEEPSHRPKTYHLTEFNSSLGRRGGRGGRRGGRGGRNGDIASSEMTNPLPKRVAPVSLDLSDSSAFPLLG